MLALGRKVMTNLDSILKNRDITLLTKFHLVKTGFSSSHVWMWELDPKEGWTLKNWCFWSVVLTLESPLERKKIKSVSSKGNQPWIFIGRIDTKVPILWPSMWRANSLKKSWCWERLRARREGGDRGWGGWTTPLAQWTWVWGHSGSWWRTRKPGVPQCMGSPTAGHNWATEQQRGMADVTHYNSWRVLLPMRAEKWVNS